MTEFLKQVVKNRLEQLDIDPANYVAKDFTEKRERIGKRNVVNLFQQQFLMKEMHQKQPQHLKQIMWKKPRKMKPL